MYQQNSQGQIVTFDPVYPLNTKIFATFETNSSGLIIDPLFDHIWPHLAKTPNLSKIGKKDKMSKIRSEEFLFPAKLTDIEKIVLWFIFNQDF